MNVWQIILIGISLAMDAFAASICKGLKMKKIDYKYTIIVAAFFGGFQALMPFIGWVLGRQFERYIESIDHWIAFVLLVVIGGKMLLEAREGAEEEIQREDKMEYDYKNLVVLAFATSIDALAVGVTFAFFKVNIVLAVSLIGIITFIISFIGVKIGNRFGIKYKSKAEIAGGVVLILIGIKILLEGLQIFILEIF